MSEKGHKLLKFLCGFSYQSLFDRSLNRNALTLDGEK